MKGRQAPATRRFPRSGERVMIRQKGRAGTRNTLTIPRMPQNGAGSASASFAHLLRASVERNTRTKAQRKYEVKEMSKTATTAISTRRKNRAAAE